MIEILAAKVVQKILPDGFEPFAASCCYGCCLVAVIKVSSPCAALQLFAAVEKTAYCTGNAGISLFVD